MDYSLLNCRHGVFLTEDRDMISAVLRAYGEWSENSFSLLKPLVPEGGVVVDIGAHIGSLALGFARLVGPGGVVFAFEPQRRLFYNLCANLLVNELFWVRAHQCLIGEGQAFASIPLGRLDRVNVQGINRGGTSFLEVLDDPDRVLAQAERVPVHDLDHFLSGSERCDLVKVDAEGAEHLVLKGMSTTLERLRPYLYLECGSEELFHRILPILESFNYRPFWHPSLHYNPNNFRKAGNVTGRKGDMNLLCVPSQSLQSAQVAPWQSLHRASSWSQVGQLFAGFEF